MVGAGFKQFAQLDILKEIGRGPLGRFFELFRPELTAKNLALPNLDASDTQYFRLVAALLNSTEVLPERLVEVASAIGDMSTPQAQERLQAAATQAGLMLASTADWPPEQLALEIWLAAPALIAREHAEQASPALITFECYASPTPKETAPPFAVPNPGAIAELSARLDHWFAEHRRGAQATRIEVSVGEICCFRVRHGGILTSAHKVNKHDTDVLHLRFVTDDTIIYLPEHNEIWISAGTPGERDLYREQFGLLLRGSLDYFSRPAAYNLELLRTDGPDALHTEGLEAIKKIVLREHKIVWENEVREVKTTSATDIFEHAGSCPCQPNPIPQGGDLVHAAFTIHFADLPTTRALEIHAPNIVKLERVNDLPSVSRWLSTGGFRKPLTT